MFSLQEIKIRLNSISKTQKITKAMNLVAISKLKKMQNNLFKIQNYCETLKEIFFKNYNNLKNNNNFKNINKNSFFIILSSDLGLCGSFNLNLIKMLKSKIIKKDQVLIIGLKGIKLLKKYKITPYKTYSKIGDKLNYDLANEIAMEINKLFLSKKFKNFFVIYNEFINPINIKANIYDLFSINLEKNILKSNSIIEFSPNSEKIFKNSLVLYFASIIFKLMAQSKISEMSMRRNAMEKANDNAEELIEKLKLEYNKIRQSSITAEINELIAGSEIK